MNGYVKFFRTVLDHELLANDNNAYIVFTKLLLRVDRKTGNYTTGRFKLAELTNLKPSTAWGTLSRLKNHKMVTLKTDSRKTVIHICNWHKFQTEPDSLLDSQPTASRQPADTKQEERREKREYIHVEPSAQVRDAYDLFIKKFDKNPNTYKLTPKRRAKINARLKDAGYKMLAQAIENTASTPFYTGDNDRGWKADLDFITRSYEQVEKLSNLKEQTKRLKLEDYT